MIEGVAHWVRRYRHGSDAVNAKGALAGLVGDVALLEKHAQVLEGKCDTVALGTVLPPAGRPFPMLADARVAPRAMTLGQGGTGSGKTFGEVGITLQYLKRGLPACRADFKGEDATIHLVEVLPAFVAELAERDREDVVARVRVLAPLREQLVVPLNPLAPAAPAVRRVRIEAIAEALDSDGSLSDRGRDVFALLAHLMASVGGTLADIAELMFDDSQLALTVARCPDAELARRANARIPTEPRQLLYALRARLDRLLADPAVAAMLLAPSCVSLGEILDDGTSIIDLSPGESSELQVRAISNLIMRELLRAAVARPDDLNRVATRLTIDEFVVGLTPEVATALSRAICLTRSKGVFFTLLAQDVSAAAQVSPHLVPALLQNCDVLKLYRSMPGAAAPWKAFLPRPAGGDGAETAASLPTGQCLYLDRRFMRHAVRLQSLQVDRDDLRRKADTLSPSLRDGIARGSWAFTVAELEKQRRPRLPRVELMSDESAPTNGTGRRSRKAARTDGFPELG